MKENFESVIGLEIHAQLSTRTKIFCNCSTEFGAPPNTNVCPVCLGHPGVLPVLNQKVVEYAAMMGVATNCRINPVSVFERKNYFYPDLPKGYQISQFQKPICSDGYIFIKTESGEKKVRLNRIHMEEDAGKSIHGSASETLIDANRCGVPLIEIVTEPDISTPEEAGLFLQKIRQIVRYLGICDGNMEEGSLRCDANISVKLKSESRLGTKTEVKNMNSVKNVEKAIAYEIERQIDLITSGGKIVQATLLWDADRQVVELMRSKEESHDYRYFPEPDLAPIVLDEIYLNEISKQIPELPDVKKERFYNQYGLPNYDAEVLTQQKDVADYFEATAGIINNYKLASNWIMTEVLRIVNERKLQISDFSVKPEQMGGLIKLIEDNIISGKIAKEVFSEMLETGKEPGTIIKEKNLVQITDSGEIEKIIEEILAVSEKEVAEYKSGKDKVFGYFVGEVMKKTKGKANPAIVNKILKEKLIR